MRGAEFVWRQCKLFSIKILIYGYKNIQIQTNYKVYKLCLYINILASLILLSGSEQTSRLR